MSPLRGASGLKENKKKQEQTIQYCRWLERQQDFLRLSFLLGFVAVLLTAQATYAVTCQPYHHDNKGHHGNKESYDLLSPLRGASGLKENKKKQEQTIQYCRWLERQQDFLRLSFLLGFVAVLLTAQATYAVTCQPYHHDNKGHHGNKESYDVK